MEEYKIELEALKNALKDIQFVESVDLNEEVKQAFVARLAIEYDFTKVVFTFCRFFRQSYDIMKKNSK